MSFKAELNIGGKLPYTVLESHYSLNQPIDDANKPIGRPTGGLITLTVESFSDTELFHWMQAPEQTKDGTIIFFKSDAASIQKKLEFTNAYCVKYDEHFVAKGKAPMTITVTISAQTLKLGDVDFNNLWGLT